MLSDEIYFTFQSGALPIYLSMHLHRPFWGKKTKQASLPASTRNKSSDVFISLIQIEPAYIPPCLYINHSGEKPTYWE